MDVYDLGEVDSTFDMLGRKTEEITRWNHHSVQIVSNTKNLSAIFHDRAVIANEKRVLKPFMSSTRDFEVEAEGGYNERDGGYIKGSVKWKFGEPDKEESQRESGHTSKGTGEVNSIDRDRDQNRD